MRFVVTLRQDTELISCVLEEIADLLIQRDIVDYEYNNGLAGTDLFGTLRNITVALRQRAKEISSENNSERIKAALKVTYRYGSIDGAHHKMWVIDQMVHALCGDEEAYQAWIKEYERADYEWDCGIKP